MIGLYIRWSIILDYQFQMKYLLERILLACLLFTFVRTIQYSEQQSISVSGDTFVTEIIVPFDMPMDDFRIAVQKQLSHDDFLTSSFTSDHVNVSKLVYKATYNGQNRTISPPGQSSKHTVWGDSIDLTVTYHALVHPSLPTRKNYNGTTLLKILLNYTKEIDTVSGVTQIQGLNVLVDPLSFKMSYTGNPSSGDKQLLDAINNGNISGKNNKTILYLLQKQEFPTNLVLGYFNENLVSQKLSPTYDSTYFYQYERGVLNATFDMTTAKVQDIDHGISHSLKGSIKNFNSNKNEESRLIKVDYDYHTLLTLNFIQNFIQYSFSQNKDWKNLAIDRNKFPTPYFGFKLVDLEYILTGFAQKYKQQYLNDIRIVCNPLNFSKIGIDEVSDKMHISVLWSCKCNLLSTTPYPTILDFDASFTHLIRFGTTSEMLTAYIEQSFFQSFVFREVDGMKVVNQDLTTFLGRQFAKSILGYTVGTYFKIKAGSSKIALKENQGLWIG